MNPNELTQMVEAFKRFQTSFKGDPKAEVMKLMTSGKLTQADLNRLQGLANQLRSLIR